LRSIAPSMPALRQVLKSRFGTLTLSGSLRKREPWNRAAMPRRGVLWASVPRRWIAPRRKGLHGRLEDELPRRLGSVRNLSKRARPSRYQSSRYGTKRAAARGDGGLAASNLSFRLPAQTHKTKTTPRLELTARHAGASTTPSVERRKVCESKLSSEEADVS